jgi:hypothetical protein
MEKGGEEERGREGGGREREGGEGEREGEKERVRERARVTESLSYKSILQAFNPYSWSLRTNIQCRIHFGESPKIPAHDVHRDVGNLLITQNEKQACAWHTQRR